MVNDTIETLVGVVGVPGETPDGTVAVDSQMGVSDQVYVHSKTGELYFNDVTYGTIRKTNMNGTLETIIFNNGITPKGLAVNEETSELFFSRGAGIFKVSLFNYSRIELVSGNMEENYGVADDRDATIAQYGSIESLFIAPGNTLFVADSANNAIRKIANWLLVSAKKIARWHSFFECDRG